MKHSSQFQVDGIINFQATDPMRASHGSSNCVFAITALAQKNNSMIVPGNMGAVSGLIATVMAWIKGAATPT